jgi:hypothetical protein
MWIKLRTLMAGPGGVIQPGSVVNLPDKQAQELVNSGQAEQVEKPAQLPLPLPEVKGKKEKATSKQAAQAETRGDEAGT